MRWLNRVPTLAQANKHDFRERTEAVQVVSRIVYWNHKVKLTVNSGTRYFPDKESIAVIQELSVWTYVDDCLAAARFIEDRPRPGDVPCGRLILPFLDSEEYEAVLVQCFAWLIHGYSVPASKVRLAALIDQDASAETWATIASVRFAPTVGKGRPGNIGTFAPPLAEQYNEHRFFVVEDLPHVIEVVQNPLRCLGDLLNRAWPTATNMRMVREKALHETGGAPTIFHQPYADGPLFALIEAMSFFVQGLALGPDPSYAGLNRGYRSFEVVGRPPLDPRLVEAAQQATTAMFRSLE